MLLDVDVQYTQLSGIATPFKNFFSTFYYKITIDYELDLITINAIILVTRRLLMYKKHVRNLIASLPAFTIICMEWLLSLTSSARERSMFNRHAYGPLNEGMDFPSKVIA